MSIVNIVTIYRSLDLYFVPKDLQEDKEKIYINILIIYMVYVTLRVNLAGYYIHCYIYTSTQQVRGKNNERKAKKRERKRQGQGKNT